MSLRPVQGRGGCIELKPLRAANREPTHALVRSRRYEPRVWQ